jgi:hypothetical protein
MTIFKSKYPFDYVDEYLDPMVRIDNYWLVREEGAAFSKRNVEGGEKEKGDLDETGLRNHLVLFNIGGAYYHLDRLENEVLTDDLWYSQKCLQFPIWQELMSFYNNLFGAREGLARFCYLVLNEKAEPEDVDSMTYRRIKPFFKKHDRLYDFFDYIDKKIELRHKLQHKYVSYLLIQDSRPKSYFFMPEDHNLIQRDVLPPERIDWGKGLEIMKESLSFIEDQINQVYDYLLNNKYIERYLDRKGLKKER